jgi:hypothetical protein
MKKLLALAALTISMATQAVTFGPVAFNGPAFAPQGQGTISTGTGFVNNFTTTIGGLLATYNGDSLTIYSTSLPGSSNTPPSTMDYVSSGISGNLANFLTYTAPMVNSAETTAAVQLGVWVLSGVNFEIVDNISLGNAVPLALTWMSAAGSGNSAFSAFSLDNKTYTQYVYAAAAVPEPTTGAMGLSGLGVLGLLALRRRR